MCPVAHATERHDPPSALPAASPLLALPADIRVCLVGATRIVRSALRQFLVSQGVSVVGMSPASDSLASALADLCCQGCDVIVLILPEGKFSAYKQVSGVLHRQGQTPPLIVLAGHVFRGHVYSALRAGAKAYVNLDAHPKELLRAIEMAVEGKVHLSPDVAQFLVEDIAILAAPSGAPKLPNTNLTQREGEIVHFLCEGLSSKEIGRQLHLSLKTVDNHRHNIYGKCHVENVAGLVRYAIQHGLVAL